MKLSVTFPPQAGLSARGSQAGRHGGRLSPSGDQSDPQRAACARTQPPSAPWKSQGILGVIPPGVSCPGESCPAETQPLPGSVGCCAPLAAEPHCSRGRETAHFPPPPPPACPIATCRPVSNSVWQRETSTSLCLLHQRYQRFLQGVSVCVCVSVDVPP